MVVKEKLQSGHLYSPSIAYNREFSLEIPSKRPGTWGNLIK